MSRMYPPYSSKQILSRRFNNGFESGELEIPVFADRDGTVAKGRLEGL